MKPVTGSILVSVVVPTYLRPQLLARCLNALVRQQFPRDTYEILVCDDAASITTRQQVEALRERCSGKPEIRYLAVEDSRGPAGARNVGWRSAKGAIIAFTDDDTIPDEDWLEHGVSALSPTVAAVVGDTDMPMPDPPSDYERDACGLTRAEFITANCFVRRSALQAVGGFDTRYTMAWREDSDLHFALLDRGFRVERCPPARVLHPVRPNRFAAGLGMQKKVMFDMLLRKKYPLLYRNRIQAHLPWFYLGVTVALLLAAVLVIMGYEFAALCAAVVWMVLTTFFFVKRLQGTHKCARNVMDLAITSAFIPLLSIYWRLVGLARFRRIGS